MRERWRRGKKIRLRRHDKALRKGRKPARQGRAEESRCEEKKKSAKKRAKRNEQDIRELAGQISVLSQQIADMKK
ncbi:hypothetical protein ACFQY7_04255 [Actinomadura luteofluorescens]|uniref:hypothetical protein n=1 Tax=Actinomadura luteofluorescens TaxID=46163 RepID=UPI003640AF2A